MLSVFRTGTNAFLSCTVFIVAMQLLYSTHLIDMGYSKVLESKGGNSTYANKVRKLNLYSLGKFNREAPL
jgi:hypothetical protein